MLGVEVGYCTKMIQSYTKDNLFKDFNIGDKLLVTGYSSASSHFVIDSVLKYDFTECDVCLKPLFSNKCIIPHNDCSTKISHLWRVVHIRDTKIFLEQNNYVISIYGKKTDFFFNNIKSAKINDIFLINAWQTSNELIVKCFECVYMGL